MHYIIPIIIVALASLVGCHSPSRVHTQPAGARVAVLEDTELIPKVYLALKYVAPKNALSTAIIASRNEHGDRLIVTGRALDQGRPVAGVSIYAFHADADGLYTKDGRNNDENARLFATLRTDAEGRYRYETIRPGGYDGLAAHVHHVVTATGFKPRLCDLWFGDEPYFKTRLNAGLPLSAGKPMFVRMPTRDSNGVWHVTHDLEMLREAD
jgi:protocatechuate 3,4-dioxygenase beta subunit